MAKTVEASPDVDPKEQAEPEAGAKGKAAPKAAPKAKAKPAAKARSGAKAKSGAAAGAVKSRSKAKPKARPKTKAKKSAPAKKKTAVELSGALVIVESPAKARTIEKFLGKGYTVKASMGHVRDLPKKTLGVDIENGFETRYTVIPDRKKNLDELKKITKGAEAVFLATDRDREGEAIAWHLAEALKVPPERIRRVEFNEITKRAILKAFEQPHEIDMSRVNAQQARRVLDRIVGYQLSPLLWEKVMRGLSAGRVQSVAVKLIVEKEKLIRAFTPEEYWEIDARLRRPGEPEFEAELKKKDGEEAKISDEKTATAMVEELRGHEFRIASLKKQDKEDKAPPPFSTSTMQQRAAIQHRFTAQKTMMIAQQLYEGIDIGPEGSVGLITYMRTDSLNVAQQALDEVRHLIGTEFGERYLPEKPHFFRSKSKTQEAHEAVRPTSVDRKPQALAAYLTSDQLKLYTLIWNRFVASQMQPSIYATTRAEIEAGPYILVAAGRTMVFDGHAKISGSRIRKDEQVLPELAEGDTLDLVELVPSQHFTEPPARFSEATLVKTLEKEGIGRPSTYAPIISLIQKRGYVERRERKFFATDLGMLVTDRLAKHFPHIMDTKFTAYLEDELDQIEEDKLDWRKALEEFYQVFSEDMERAKKEMRNLVEEPELSEENCEKCGKPMAYKWSKGERFLGCTGYPDCKSTKSLKKREGPPPVETEYDCEKCGSKMLLRTGRNGPFLACSGYPKCKSTVSVDDEGKPIELPKVDEKCEKCGKPMIVRTGRRGPFVACSGYPKCRNTKPLPGDEPEKTDEKCENCGKEMVVRRGRRGPFLACSGYPECKTSKPMKGEAAPKKKAAESKEPEPSGVDCPECGAPMLFKWGRRGRFMACSAYPECKTTRTA